MTQNSVQKILLMEIVQTNLSKKQFSKNCLKTSNKDNTEKKIARFFTPGEQKIHNRNSFDDRSQMRGLFVCVNFHPILLVNTEYHHTQI